MDFSNDDIIHVKNENIEYIQFKRLLEYGIKHCYTLKGENINFKNDNPLIEESYIKVCKSLGINRQNITIPKQSHTSSIRCIDRVMGYHELEDIDGVITDKKYIALSTLNADCILFLIYDPIKKVIANIHSGWRGTFQKIIEKAVVKMVNQYGCNTEDLIVCISPCIRKCHFEVDEEVKVLCEEIFGFMGNTNEFIEKGEIKDGKQKYYIDNVLINKLLLKELGVKEENIIDSNLCSVCNSEKINSYRADGNIARSTAIIQMG